VLTEKALDKLCPECGEDMKLNRDYGLRGESFNCASCGFFQEVIDLRS
jgi:predicted RNA-binding Zn-ribbon protein involved in translation (DUF1610 family)